MNTLKNLLVVIVVGFSQTLFAGTVVVVDTSMGQFEIELYDQKSPIAVENFLKYVDSEFYNGTIVYRVEKDFVIQGGGLMPNGESKPEFPPIPSEANNGASHKKWTLGMARYDHDINSATADYFVNTADNSSFLDGNYTAFAEVIKGFEVVQAIENVPVKDSAPVDHVHILSMKRK